MCRWPRARPLLLLALAQATHAWHEGHRVSGFEHVLSAPSYAGLLPGGNGSAAAEAELFYWLFLAQNGKPNAPVVVWMNGGPGLSSMFSLFNEHGPLQLDGQDKLQPRQVHWNEQWHLLFVDQPLGVGFSEYGAAGPSHTLRDTTEQLYGFLQALLRTHPELQELDIYLAGDSFCGHYFPPLARHILVQNAAAAAGAAPGVLPLRLAGVSIGGMQADVRARVLGLPAQASAFGLITRAQRARGDALARQFAAELDRATSSGASTHAAMRTKDRLEAFLLEGGVDRLNLARQAGSYCLQAYPRWMDRNAAALHASRAKFKAHSPAPEAALIADRGSEARDDRLRTRTQALPLPPPLPKPLALALALALPLALALALARALALTLALTLTLTLARREMTISAATSWPCWRVCRC